jgi:preprotein translocase subunit SecG
MGSVVVGVLLIVYVLLCAFLILIVLLQRGEGGGLAGAFGGMGGESAFGVKGDKTFKKLTAIVGALFMVLAVVISIVIERQFRPPAATGSSGVTVPAEESPGSPEGQPKPK